MKGKWFFAGLIGFLLVALCIGMMVSAYFFMAAGIGGDIQWTGLAVNGVSAKATEEKHLAVDGPAEVSVTTPFGRISVVGSETSEIVVIARKTSFGINESEAKAALDGIKIISTQTGNNIAIRVEQPVQVSFMRIGPSGGQVDFEIQVPRDCKVTANSSSGDISLEGTTLPAKLESSYGRVTASDVESSVEIRSNSGNVAVRNIRAGNGAVLLHTDFGDVEMESVVAESVLASTNSGSVTLEKVDAGGLVEAKTNFGSVAYSDGSAEKMEVRTSSGEINIYRVEVAGSITAHSDFGGVAVAGSPAQAYDLSSNSGDITVRDAAGTLKAETSFGGIEVSGENVRMELRTGSGSIAFTGSLADGRSVMQTDFGSMRIALPEGAEFEFDLRTGFGSIESEFPLPIQGSSERSHMTGSVGKGGAILNARTSSGNIELVIR